MADDLDAQLSELEDKAPLTIEGEAEDVTDYGPGNPKPEDADVNAKPEDKDAGKADEWKPPTKETYENIQKALRAEREQRRQEAQRARLYEQNISAMEQHIQAWQQQTLAQQLQTPPQTRPPNRSITSSISRVRSASSGRAIVRSCRLPRWSPMPNLVR
jgi:hypothetical protein